MKFFGYELTKSVTPEAFSVHGERTTSELHDAMKSFEWVRSVLVSSHGCAPPSVDPFLLSTLFDCNGYHSNAIYWKQAATVSQGYECSDALRAHIEEANEDDSLADLLEKFSLDLETYGSAYIEPVITAAGVSFYHSPALLTRVKPPASDDDPALEESFVQFAYKKGYGVRSLEFEKFRMGMRTGMRQLKLTSPNADRWYGQPEYLSAKRVLTLNFSIIALIERWFDNSMMLDKLFTIEGTNLSPEQRRELGGFMKRSFKGIEHAAKSLILELKRPGKLSVQDMNSSIKEAPYIELRRENRDEIASAHRVPPRLLSIIPAGQLGATGEVEGQLKIFKIGFADPRQRKIEAFFRKLFRDCRLPDWQTFRLMPMDVTAGSIDAQTLNLLTGGQPIITPEEARQDWYTEKQLAPRQLYSARQAAAALQQLSIIRQTVDSL